MAKIFLDPVKYQEQVDTFKEGSEAIAASKCKVDNTDQVLKSVTKYKECIREFNALIKAFGDFSELDIHSMQLIKAKWMNADTSIAEKTFGEILFKK